MSDTTDPLHDVRQLAEDVRTQRAVLDAAMATRDTAIRDALAAGTSVVDLVRATGLTRAQIYNVRDKKEK